MSTDSWRREGSVRPWDYEIVAPGFKYNMSEVHAAIGLAQLAKLPEFYARRRHIVERYGKAFSALEHVRVPSEKPNVESACHIYALRLELEALSIGRDRFIEELRSRRINTSVHFKPVHMHPYFRQRYGFEASEFPVASDAFRRIVSLPLYPAMSDADVDDVIEAVVDVLAHFGR
jgi:dTDP-4-amino-4,6-dideoxygalactose transaminase